MDENSTTERLWDIARRFGVHEPIGLVGTSLPPFDISQPNFHLSKADFSAELQAVEKALKDTESLALFLAAPYRETDTLKAVATPVSEVINDQACKSAQAIVPKSPIDLIQKNAGDTDLCFATAILLLDTRSGLISRFQQLKDQERTYWNLKGRAPNHYARAIALRFARLVAKHTGKRPTVGVSREGNFPSTDFGRALEEIFELLDIKAVFRRHAQWAVAELTDDDFRVEPVNVFRDLMNFSVDQVDPRRDALAAIFGTDAKGDEE
ncbi:hypothetical protein [Gymnodinialimonas sp. 57CJ19]|uniref:hypothetical protein n=1 Tax=Gymnodinialimonas sp. 57CJ19 TaxID=3138498 RepID=UPI0031343CC5